MTTEISSPAPAQVAEAGISKKCSKCGEVKLLALFHSAGSGKLEARCKACARIQAVTRRHNDAEAIAARQQALAAANITGTKRCHKCETTRPTLDFSKNKCTYDGLQGQCKICANAYKAENLSVISAGKRALGVKEREEIRAHKASPEYKARRNAQRRERTATDPLWRARKSVMDMWSRFLSGGSDTHLERWGCTRKEFWAHIATTFQPGMTIENYRDAWEIDHIWPTSRASEHPDPDFNVWHYSNTQALTTRQNSQKKNRTPEEYTQFLKEVEQHGV